MLPTQTTIVQSKLDAFQALANNNDTIAVVENEPLDIRRNSNIQGGKLHINLPRDGSLIRNVRMNGELCKNPILMVNGIEIAIQPSEWIPIESLYYSLVTLIIDTAKDLNVTIDVGYVSCSRRTVLQGDYRWKNMWIVNGSLIPDLNEQISTLQNSINIMNRDLRNLQRISYT